MKKIILFLVLFIMLSPTLFSQECDVRFDGLYVVKAEVDGDDVQKYLRFYQNDSVVSVLSEDKIDVVSQWITKDVEDISIGKYKAKKCKIKFTTENSTGKYKHKGTFSETGLSIKKYYEEWPEPQQLEFEFIEVKLKE